MSTQTLPAPTPINLDSGTLRFGDSLTGQTFDLDLLTLQLSIEQVEMRHNLQKVDGHKVATEDFLNELAYTIKGKGFINCTPTQAHQIWILSAVAMGALKKNIRSSVTSVSGFTSTLAPSPARSASDTTPTLAELNPNHESTKG